MHPDPNRQMYEFTNVPRYSRKALPKIKGHEWYRIPPFWITALLYPEEIDMMKISSPPYELLDEILHNAYVKIDKRNFQEFEQLQKVIVSGLLEYLNKSTVKKYPTRNTKTSSRASVSTKVSFVIVVPKTK